MNPFLLKIAQFVSKRPKDGTILAMHIITGLLIIGILFWAQDISVIDVPFYGTTNPEMELKIEYGLMILALFFIGRGLITACVLKHNWLRIKQAIHGLALIIVGGPMMDPIVTTLAGNSNNELGIITESIVQNSWHPGIFLVLLGIFWILVGATGKGTMSKCIRYGEIVKKIRV